MRLKQSDKIILIIVLILITTYLFIKIFSYRSEPILLDYASSQATNIVNSIINKSISIILDKENVDNIIKDVKDKNENVINIDFDNKVVNKIYYLLNEKLLSDLSNIEKAYYKNINTKYLNSTDKMYYVPLGITTNTPILNSLGPQIPFKIDFIGNVNNEVKTYVKEYGINSSLVELVINIKLKIQVIMPFKSKIIDIEKSILLDSKIVQGIVPNYYGGVYSSVLPGSLK